MDRFSQLAIAYHIAYLKVFIGNQVARRDIRVCHLSGKIFALPLNLQMLLGKCFPGFLPVSRFLLFTGKSLLETFELVFGFAIVTGILDRGAVRVGDVCFESHINPKLLACWNVFDLAFGLNTELAAVAICTSDNANALDHALGKFLDTLIGIPNKLQASYPTAIGEDNMTAIVVNLPARGFVLDASIIVLKLGVSFLSRFFILAVLIEARNSKPSAICTGLTSHRVEATSKGGVLSKHFAVGLQVVFGCTRIVHPQPQAFVADELDSANGFVDSGELFLAPVQLVLVDQHAVCSSQEYRSIISHMSIYIYSSYRRGK